MHRSILSLLFLSWKLPALPSASAVTVTFSSRHVDRIALTSSRMFQKIHSMMNVYRVSYRNSGSAIILPTIASLANLSGLPTGILIQETMSSYFAGLPKIAKTGWFSGSHLSGLKSGSKEAVWKRWPEKWVRTKAPVAGRMNGIQRLYMKWFANLWVRGQVEW